MKNTSNTLLYAALAATSVGVIALVSSSKPKSQDVIPEPAASNPTTGPKPVTLNLKLLLKKGSTGPEVGKLQEYLGVTADQAFGPVTEAALLKIKGVKETTLEKFATLPTLNQNRLPVGTRVMAENKSGANLYLAKKKADGSFFKDTDLFTTISYGDEIGTIRSSSFLGNWYVVAYDAFSGQQMVFVKAADVKKI